MATRTTCDFCGVDVTHLLMRVSAEAHGHDKDDDDREPVIDLCRRCYRRLHHWTNEQRGKRT